MIHLIILVANSVAVDCIDYACRQVSYDAMRVMIQMGMLELIFEVFSFIRIYRRKENDEGISKEDTKE